MATFPSVGQELLDVPLPEMVVKLAMGIASAQAALDENSVSTAQLLATTEVPGVVLAVTQTISATGEVSFTQTTADMSLLQLGLLPTFYQFAEAKVGFAMWSASVQVDVSHNRKFQKEVRGTSRLVTRLVPVPPPQLIKPVFTTIDNRPVPPVPEA